MVGDVGVRRRARELSDISWQSDCHLLGQGLARHDKRVSFVAVRNNADSLTTMRPTGY